jgi:tetratricopeptide (TPR) repeat protein
LRATHAKSIVGSSRVPALSYIAKTMLSIHFGSEREIRSTFETIPPECSAFPLLKTQVFLNQALYYLGWHDGESAKKILKAATLLCQKDGNVWLSRCHRLFALASLSELRIGETNEYLGFALENAVKSGEPQEIGMASYYTASVQFLHGNLSKALTLARKALRHFLEAGSPEWADRSRFLEGRLAFESGSYDQAADIFNDIKSMPHGILSPEKSGMFDAWIYRAKIYAAKKSVPCPQNRVLDTELFEIEAMYFDGDYSEIVQQLDKLAAAHPDEDIFYGTEQSDWRSGFSQCELLCFSWHELRGRILGAYRSIAQAHTSPKEAGGGIVSMQQILQNSHFAEIDPCDAFYRYAFYRILKQTGAGQLDLRTAASVAHKRLQVRAGRIDSPDMRRKYVTQPHWNKSLEETAKEYMLV